MDIILEQRRVIAAQQGDEQAFEELYNSFVDKIYGYLSYRLDCPNVARDLTSDVFIRVADRLPSYRSGEVPFLSWLFRIAHARLVEYNRQSNHSTQRVCQEDTEFQIPSDADDQLEMNRFFDLRQQQIHDALHTLTDDQQQVIWLHFIEGYNLEEIATLLGKTVSVIKLVQFRAIQSLGRVLGGKELVYNHN